MPSDKTVFTHPAQKVASCMAVTGSLPGVFLDAPDYLLVRARDLKHILQALDAALHLRADGRSAWASRAFHTERTAIGQLRNISNSSQSLQDFLVSMPSAAIVRGGGVAGSLRDGGGDGADFSAYPHGNHGDNQTPTTSGGVL